MVRQPGARPVAGPGLLHLGRLRQLRQLSAGTQGCRIILLAGRHLGERASGADPQRLYGQSRVVLLRLARRRRPPILRAGQRRRDESMRITVSISDLMISHGQAVLGGGVLNQQFSDLALSRVTLLENQSLGPPSFST